MMSQVSQDKLERLKEYMKLNVAPILITDVTPAFFINPIVIDHTCSKEELNAYSKENWYQKTKKEEDNPFIIIDEITQLEKEEQLKFLELIKYRKIGEHVLNDKFIIILTSKKENLKNLNETLASYVVQI